MSGGAGRALQPDPATPGITYRLGNDLDLDDFVELYRASTLAERRPAGDRERMERMLAGSNLLVSAWDGALAVGLARSITDRAYCTYLSDLAVRSSHQRRGIGAALIRATAREAGPDAPVHLLSAPGAVEFYEAIGLERFPAAFRVAAGRSEAPGR